MISDSYAKKVQKSEISSTRKSEIVFKTLSELVNLSFFTKGGFSASISQKEKKKGERQKKLCFGKVALCNKSSPRGSQKEKRCLSTLKQCIRFPFLVKNCLKFLFNFSAIFDFISIVALTPWLKTAFNSVSNKSRAQIRKYESLIATAACTNCFSRQIRRFVIFVALNCK